MNYTVFLPEILVLITASIVLFGEWAFKSIDNSTEKKVRNIGFVTLLGMFAALGVLLSFETTGYGLITSFFSPETSTFYSSFVLDSSAIYFKIIILISSILTVLISFKYVSDKIKNVGEFYALICMATLGGMFMSSANEMISMYLGIELISISSYILCCFNKDHNKSSESALKYFIVGGLSSAILLYGFSLLFGLTGFTQFPQLASTFDKFTAPELNAIFLIGVIMSIAGLGYKIAAVPFHAWAPDVYEGAPTPITAFLSITSKIAGFAAISRFFLIFNNSMSEKLVVLVAVLSVLTMCIGNFLSLAQKNIKRLFAYSSIAQAGYLLMGLIPLLMNRMDDSASILFYLTAYIFMNIGCFAAIIYFSKFTGSTDIEAFAGVAKKSPFIAFVFSCCLISLAGLPPFGGFTGKFYLFVGAVNSGYTWLAFVGAVNSVISLYYYVKIIKTMYFVESTKDIKFELPNAGILTAVILSLAGILILFLVPYPFIQMAKMSALGL
ncbi:MAG: NADH-quinone oxidoreductase subunit N [Candidatus Sericytochromatia bacterium]|nr:NADH-quinone oxidoreductase subunit N [Candidatus Sericytochromatia bacterium]